MCGVQPVHTETRKDTPFANLGLKMALVNHYIPLEIINTKLRRVERGGLTGAWIPLFLASQVDGRDEAAPQLFAGVTGRQTRRRPRQAEVVLPRVQLNGTGREN